MISGREKLAGLYAPWKAWCEWVLQRADEAGLNPTVTSGRRSSALQATLYKRYVQSGYNKKFIAAPPGRSAHEYGLAIDCWGDDQAALIKLFKRYGAETVAGDPEHFQYPGYKNALGA